MNSTETPTLQQRKPPFTIDDTIRVGFDAAIREAHRRAVATGVRQLVTLYAKNGERRPLYDVQVWR